jgi:2-desacetyl-2-hydroxyethyl bacteriochlorophyllide A dehydrogenase
MKAVVLKKPYTLAVEDVPKPSLEPDEVLVEVKACGICGSDLRYFEGENPWALHTLGENKENPPNIILGHEFAGVVAEVANPALSDWIGRRVVVSPYKACGLCHYCRIGKYNLCVNTVHLGHGAGWGTREYYPGGMARFCQVWADKVYALPDSVSFDEATLLDIAGVGIHALSISNMTPGATVAIIGLGPLGSSLVQTARIWGARRVYCSEIAEKPLELAVQQGADLVVNPAKDSLVERVLEKTDRIGVDVVIDTVGLTETQNQALKILAPGGTLVNMATNANELSFKLLQLSGERTIKSSSNYFFHDFQCALDLTAAGRLDLKPLITHRFPIDKAVEAFDVMLKKEKTQALKVVILP